MHDIITCNAAMRAEDDDEGEGEGEGEGDVLWNYRD
jgi:hypothetical protein